MKKNIIITGANRGIGLGLCEHYLQAGHSVIAGCRALPFPFKSYQDTHKLTTLALDLSDAQSIEAFTQEVKSLDIKIDLLINNAGITQHQTFGEWEQSTFLESFNVNAVGPALLVQGLDTLLANQAKIIQLSSGLASITNTQHSQDTLTPYSMSKTALNMLTKRLAGLYESRNITAASVSPGWVKTKMGGEEAPDTVEQATLKVTRVIEALTLQQTGQFFDEQGQPIEW